MKTFLIVCIVVMAALLVMAPPVLAGCSEAECNPPPAWRDCTEAECDPVVVYVPPPCPSCARPTPVFDTLPLPPEENPRCRLIDGAWRCKPWSYAPKPEKLPESAVRPTPVFDWPLWPVVVYDNPPVRGSQILRAR